MSNTEQTENVVPASNSVKSAKTTTKTKQVKKESKPKRSLLKVFKETMSELKKVTWPSFATVVKQTAVVITVVLIFAVVILGFDLVFSELYKLLVNVVK